MKYTLPLLLLLVTACAEPAVVVDAGQLRLTVGADGDVVGLEDVESGTDFLSGEGPAPLLAIRRDSVDIPPENATWQAADSTLLLTYPGETDVGVRVRSRATHAVLEVVSVSGEASMVLWGPYPTTMDDMIGETVGVVHEAGFAVGLQALNLKTLGGYPWNENDAMPQLDVFESGDYSDLSEEGKRYVLYRVEAARPDSLGSRLQAYTRDRSAARTIPNWRYEEYRAPAFDDGGLVGSSIALFGSPSDQALATIGAIERREGLPHPMLDGEWIKTSPRAAQAYMILPFTERDLDRAMDAAQRAGFQYLYHPEPFATWGHFALGSEAFPRGMQSLRSMVDRASERGLRLGAHSLSNFITTNDPYVTPEPDPRLARVGGSVLSTSISSSGEGLEVDSPGVFQAGLQSTLRTVVVGSELIQYSAVSETEPWRLTGVTRGAFGTRAGAHEAGNSVELLADHPYRVFLTDPELSIEMAGNLGRVFQESGLRHVSFDGLEGNRSTGMGNYGEVLFAQSFWDALSPERQENLIVTASRTSHFFWHHYARMNWGEPWYAGFRESQTEYRIKNQAYFKRNLMPAMLGWFSMRDETSVEDVEWMLALSAAFDAGYSFSTSLEVMDRHGRTGEILDLLALWEEARLSGAFTPEQKARMESRESEFHLEGAAGGGWTLYPMSSARGSFANREWQPGEPAMQTVVVSNDGPDQALRFVVTASEAALTRPVFSIGGRAEIQLPVRLRSGEVLQYDGGDRAVVYGPAWRALRSVPVDASAFLVAEGEHSVTFSASFDNPGSGGEARLEFRLAGPGEPVGR